MLDTRVIALDPLWVSTMDFVAHRPARFWAMNYGKERPMKVRNSLRSLKNKPGAQVVRRRGKVYVINKKEPRFKARQG